MPTKTQQAVMGGRDASSADASYLQRFVDYLRSRLHAPPTSGDALVTDYLVKPGARALGGLFQALDAPPSRNYPADMPYASPLRVLGSANAMLPAAAGLVFDTATGAPRRPLPVVNPMAPIGEQATFAGEAERRGLPSVVSAAGTLADLFVGPEHGLQALGAAKVLGAMAPLAAIATKEAPTAAAAEHLRELLKAAGFGMSEEKIQRAASLGHDLVLHHGTQAVDDFPQFRGPVAEGLGDFGIHADPKASVADRFTFTPKGYTRPADAAGPRILPLTARSGNIVDLPDVITWKDPEYWTRMLKKDHPVDDITASPELVKDLYNTASRYNDARYAAYDNAAELNQSEFYKNFQRDILKVLKDHGVDTIRYKNYLEGVGGPSYVFTNPNQLRSIFAKYNPANIASPDLLASLAPVAVAGGAAALAKSENTKGKK